MRRHAIGWSAQSGLHVCVSRASPVFLTHSLHRAATKAAIYKSESCRALINCSKQCDYEQELARLEQGLAKRGFPGALCVKQPYNEARRRRLLDKFAARQASAARNNVDCTPVFSCDLHFAGCGLHKTIVHLCDTLKSYGLELPKIRMA